ncbi:MAG TPA: HD domain-containing protein, partial [Gemmatimonadales bacterium]
YPGATHRRFEHSLGVMELATRVFDVVTREENLTDPLRSELGELQQRRAYWRNALRMAALCHDIGHLPFSHAAEKELLPGDWTHERLTAALVRSGELQSVWNKLKIQPEDVVKLALGPKELPQERFTAWETILAEIVVGDALGVDRMDYLLRDSDHAGVAYGRFDHYRLIDTMRILPSPPTEEGDQGEGLALGVEEGGLQSAEALLLARYFMFSQVYCHPVRRIYDIHLKDFLKEWLPAHMFSTETDDHLKMTDTEVTAAMRLADRDSGHPGHLHARRILRREHFKPIYQRNPSDSAINPEAGRAVFFALCDKFGADSFRHDRYPQGSGTPDFSVLPRNGKVASSLALSQVLDRLPAVSIDYVFADRVIEKRAAAWIDKHRDEVIRPKSEEESHGQAS